MARIKVYDNDPQIQPGDKIIGTDVTNGDTKNFTIEQLGAYFETTITGGGTTPGTDITGVSFSKSGNRVTLTLEHATGAPFVASFLENEGDGAIHTGTEDPVTSQVGGLAGDFYFQSDFSDPDNRIFNVYGPLVQATTSSDFSSWDTVGPNNLIGPQGDQGIQGIQGDQGVGILDIEQDAPVTATNTDIRIELQDPAGGPLDGFIETITLPPGADGNSVTSVVATQGAGLGDSAFLTITTNIPGLETIGPVEIFAGEQGVQGFQGDGTTVALTTPATSPGEESVVTFTNTDVDPDTGAIVTTPIPVTIQPGIQGFEGPFNLDIYKAVDEGVIGAALTTALAAPSQIDYEYVGNDFFDVGTTTPEITLLDNDWTTSTAHGATDILYVRRFRVVPSEIGASDPSVTTVTINAGDWSDFFTAGSQGIQGIQGDQGFSISATATSNTGLGEDNTITISSTEPGVDDVTVEVNAGNTGAGGDDGSTWHVTGQIIRSTDTSLSALGLLTPAVVGDLILTTASDTSGDVLEIITTNANNTVVTLALRGNIRGPQGEAGTDGDDGDDGVDGATWYTTSVQFVVGTNVNISSLSNPENGDIILISSGAGIGNLFTISQYNSTADTATLTASGNIRGAVGATGADAVYMTVKPINGSALTTLLDNVANGSTSAQNLDGAVGLAYNTSGGELIRMTRVERDDPDNDDDPLVPVVPEEFFVVRTISYTTNIPLGTGTLRIVGIEQSATTPTAGNYAINLTGQSGVDGSNIDTIARTSGDGSAGTLDTYTVTLTDGSTSTFQVQNGNDGDDGDTGVGIASIARTNGDGSAGSLDTYTVTFTDTSTTTFTVQNGDDGDDGAGITSIARTTGDGSAGTLDTYTITFSDATTTTFSVQNGTNGTNGTDGVGIASIVRTTGDGSEGTIDTYTITFTDNTTQAYNVVNGADGTNGTNGNDGVGITSIARTAGNGSEGTTDTYTITFTDASTQTYTVVNGADGEDGMDGDDGAQGISRVELYHDGDPGTVPTGVTLNTATFVLTPNAGETFVTDFGVADAGGDPYITFAFVNPSLFTGATYTIPDTPSAWATPYEASGMGVAGPQGPRGLQGFQGDGTTVTNVANAGFAGQPTMVTFTNVDIDPSDGSSTSSTVVATIQAGNVGDTGKEGPEGPQGTSVVELYVGIPSDAPAGDATALLAPTSFDATFNPTTGVFVDPLPTAFGTTLFTAEFAVAQAAAQTGADEGVIYAIRATINPDDLAYRTAVTNALNITVTLSRAFSVGDVGPPGPAGSAGLDGTITVDDQDYNDLTIDDSDDSVVFTAAAPVDGVGTATVALSTTGVVAGTYGSHNDANDTIVIPSINVDDQGRIRSITPISVDITGGSTPTPGQHGSIDINLFEDIGFDADALPADRGQFRLRATWIPMDVPGPYNVVLRDETNDSELESVSDNSGTFVSSFITNTADETITYSITVSGVDATGTTISDHRSLTLSGAHTNIFEGQLTGVSNLATGVAIDELLTITPITGFTVSIVGVDAGNLTFGTVDNAAGTIQVTGLDTTAPNNGNVVSVDVTWTDNGDADNSDTVRLFHSINIFQGYFFGVVAQADYDESTFEPNADLTTSSMAVSNGTEINFTTGAGGDYALINLDSDITVDIFTTSVGGSSLDIEAPFDSIVDDDSGYTQYYFIKSNSRTLTITINI